MSYVAQAALTFRATPARGLRATFPSSRARRALASSPLGQPLSGQAPLLLTAAEFPGEEPDLGLAVGPSSAKSCLRTAGDRHLAERRPSGAARSFSREQGRGHSAVSAAVEEVRHDGEEGQDDGNHEEEGHHEELHPTAIVEEEGPGYRDDHHGEEGKDDAHAAHGPRLLPPALAGFIAAAADLSSLGRKRAISALLRRGALERRPRRPREG